MILLIPNFKRAGFVQAKNENDSCWVVAVHDFNPNTWQVEEGGSL